VDFSDVADDFFVNLNLQTTLQLPTSRETILHFFEAVQKEFPAMTNFAHGEGGEHVLEGDRDSGCYQWLEVQPRRMCAGYFNPPTADHGYQQHRWLLDRSTYFLGVSGLDVECLDVLFGFNLDFHGNRDAIIAQALLGNSPLAAFAADIGKPLECEPSVVIALDESCSLQARLSVETRSSSYQVRTGNYEDDPITVYLTIRQYPRPGQLIKLQDSFTAQCEFCEDVASRIVVPNIIQPICAAIAAAQ
jgi:hypothetical protein